MKKVLAKRTEFEHCSFHRISFNDGLQSTANCRILKNNRNNKQESMQYGKR